jgi:hypothetical protein
MTDITNLLQTIDNSKIQKDKKDYLKNFINSTMSSDKLTDSQKAYKIGLAINTFNSYLSEKELNSIKLILADTFKLTALEVSQPFKNAFNAIEFITRPYILIPLALIGLYIWYKYLR